ncbi:galactosyltransferase domain-containing protein [Phthorimaea operculella]|nr:galactosyltransferase domain-containing protein [Phthorimaea operculella]
MIPCFGGHVKLSVPVAVYYHLDGGRSLHKHACHLCQTLLCCTTGDSDTTLAFRRYDAVGCPGRDVGGRAALPAAVSSGRRKTVASASNAPADSAPSTQPEKSSASSISSSNAPPANVTSSSRPAPPASSVKPKPDNKAPRVVLTKELYTGGHSWPHPERCPSLGAGIQLLILVTTAPSHGAARDAIRLTWGSFALRKDIAIVFVIGQPPDAFRDKLEAEDEMYGDIVMGNFVDSYSNLTLKTISMLEWTDTYCPRARSVLKTDDDMFINVPKLLQFRNYGSRVNATSTIWGKVLKKGLPKRTPQSKYYLSRTQYPKKILPDFATGPAYLLTRDAIHPLLSVALSQPYVRLEDVYVTGILANKVGVKRQHAHEFYNRKISPHPCAVQRGISIHMVRYHEQFDLWRKLLDHTAKCS